MKAFRYLYVSAGLGLMLATSAGAYLDPSVMTYTIQVVAGIVIAAGAVVGIYWRRAKRKVQDKLGIDPDAKKEKEADVVVFSDDTGDKK